MTMKRTVNSSDPVTARVRPMMMDCDGESD